MSVTIKNELSTGRPKKEDYIKDFNELLATIAIVAQNLRSLHWLVEGKMFQRFHQLFGDYYDTEADRMDVIAERIIMLQATPFQTYSEYIENSKIEEIKDVIKPCKGLKLYRQMNKALISLERQLIAKSEKLNDYVTTDMLIKCLTEREKQNWMMQATLKEFKDE